MPQAGHCQAGAVAAAVRRWRHFGQGIDVVRNCENLIGGPVGDSLTGTDGKNHIRGLAGDDTILGLAGDDILDGGPGTNVMDGGYGMDMVTYERSRVAVTVDVAAGTGGGGGGADTPRDLKASYADCIRSL